MFGLFLAHFKPSSAPSCMLFCPIFGHLGHWEMANFQAKGGNFSAQNCSNMLFGKSDPAPFMMIRVAQSGKFGPVFDSVPPISDILSR